MELKYRNERKVTAMKFFDISKIHQDAPLYPGSSKPVIDRVYDMKNGAPFNASMITSGSHIGTHADAHCHFLMESNISIDQMELWRYYGACRVITTPENHMITKEDLQGKLENAERLVIHGGGYSYLTPEAARYVVDCGIVAIITDAWSIAPLDNEAEIHQIIMSEKLAVVESVILDEVPDGDYTISAFPVKYGGCDGAPVRAVLMKE